MLGVLHGFEPKRMGGLTEILQMQVMLVLSYRVGRK